jgi:3-hydroxy-9,10-secoandrosta-1,3,5(10)-triene-9,17-dione monooxygenase
MQPARIGGAEAEIGAIVDVMIPIACGCPSTAWCLAQYIMHNYMIARWPAQAQEAVWQDPASLVSGILIPRLGRAHAVDGGYLISGAWPFVSGVEPSDWCMLSAYVERADTANEERYFLVRTSSIAILDTWHSIGLRGSGSQDVQADDLFVPDYMSLSIQQLKGGECPGRAVNRGAVYRLPVIMTFGIVLGASLVGMAESMFEGFLMQSRERRALMSNEETASFQTHQARIGEVSASLQAAEALLRADCREMMEFAEGDYVPGNLERSSYRCNGAYAGMLAHKAAQTVWDLIGARGAYQSNVVARLYQDIAVATRHTAMNWEVNAIEHGRARLRMPLSNASL